MGDGLDSLIAMRAKTTAASRRTLPPPRHQPRRTPVPMPDPTPTAELVRSSTPPSADDPPPPATASLAGATATPPAAGDLTRVSIYLDEPTDAYLETVRTAARTARPRVDATRSAVVRLALTRLAEQLDPIQVVAELQCNAAAHTGPGRKRA